MYKNRKNNTIAPISHTNWEVVPLDYVGEGVIVAWLGGIAPIKLITGLTQEQFDKLYPAI